VALWCALPSLLLLGLWMIFDDPVINSMVIRRWSPPDSMVVESQRRKFADE